MPCTERYLRDDGTIAERDCYAADAPARTMLPTGPDLSRTPGDEISFLGKIRSFATAAAQHVAAGMPMASDAEILRRHDICMACPFFRNNTCAKCGCPISRARGYVSKLSWADSECPVGKWGKESVENRG